MRLIPTALAALLVIANSATATASTALPSTSSSASQKRSVLNEADAIVAGTVSKIVSSTILESYPGIYVISFRMSGTRWLKGTPTAAAVFHYSKRARGSTAPVLPKVGDKLVLSATRTDQNLGKKQSWYTVTAHHAANPASLSMARAAARIPFAGTHISGLKRTPAALKMSVQQIAPVTPKKWVNPYGDGRFRLRLTNTSRRRVTVPGVFVHKRSRKVLWRHSLVVATGAAAMRWPRPKLVRRQRRQLRPLTLAPGKAVSFTVDTSELPGLPRNGGARIGFTFAVGNASASSFFYYSDQYHWPHRVAARARLVSLGISP